MRTASKRIIPCMDIAGGRVVKGVNFVDLKDAGDPVEIAKAYDHAGADELVFLDIAATNENRKTTIELVKKVVSVISIPLAVGGGISEISDFEALIEAGAKKVSINTAAVINPQLIKQAAEKFGSNRVVVAIDAKQTPQGFKVIINGGLKMVDMDAAAWAKQTEELGAGEILLTSMDRDGTKNGYDLELLKAVTASVDIPVIASGGAGNMQHMADAITIGGADAVLAASLFHFKEVEIPILKEFLSK